jgi:hypothetical protein
MFISVPDRIRIRPKVSDPYESGSGSATLMGGIQDPGSEIQIRKKLFPIPGSESRDQKSTGSESATITLGKLGSGSWNLMTKIGRNLTESSV